MSVQVLATNPSPAKSTKRRDAKRSWDSLSAPIITVIVLLSLWQIIAWVNPSRSDLFPGPTVVAAKLPEALENGLLLGAVGTSLFRALSGFFIAVLIATPIALLLAHQPLLRKGVGPLISAMQVLPSIAWVPAAIILFGLSNATIYTVLLLGAVPSIINGLLSGIDLIPHQYRALSQVLGANKRQHIWHVELPAALPGYVAGLRQGWAFAWRSLMAAELIAVGGSFALGVGSLLQRGRDLADLPLVILVIVVILFVGVLIELLCFAPIERKLLRDRGISRTGGKSV